jgi:hypothetical protein
MGSAIRNSHDHVQRALDSAEDVQRSIRLTRQAIERSQSLLTDGADPWPASPERIRQKFWSHLA